jgi:hypothetical protein
MFRIAAKSSLLHPIRKASSMRTAAVPRDCAAKPRLCIAGRISRLAYFSLAFAGKRDAFLLDFHHSFRYLSSNTPASPLPLCGDANNGQVFLCADGLFPAAAGVAL